MATCYRQSQGGYVASFPGVQACTNSTSAGGYTTCCFPGSLCLANGLCYATTPDPGTTGYYDALCSDPMFQDSSCSKHCFAYTKGDAIYDTTLNRWRCCGTTANGAANCQNPTNVTFAGPSPAILLAQATGSTTSSSTASSTSASLSTLSTSTGSSTMSSTSSSSSAAGTSASTSTSTPDSGLSTGAKAGVGIGIAVVVIALLGLLYRILSSKRRKSRTHHGEQQPGNHYGVGHSHYKEKYPNHAAELSPAPEYVAAEMSGNNYDNHKPYAYQHPSRVHELGS